MWLKHSTTIRRQFGTLVFIVKELLEVHTVSHGRTVVGHSFRCSWLNWFAAKWSGIRVYDHGTCLNFHIRVGAFSGAEQTNGLQAVTHDPLCMNHINVSV